MRQQSPAREQKLPRCGDYDPRALHERPQLCELGSHSLQSLLRGHSRRRRGRWVCHSSGGRGGGQSWPHYRGASWFLASRRPRSASCRRVRRRALLRCALRHLLILVHLLVQICMRKNVLRPGRRCPGCIRGSLRKLGVTASGERSTRTHRLSRLALAGCCPATLNKVRISCGTLLSGSDRLAFQPLRSLSLQLSHSLGACAFTLDILQDRRRFSHHRARPPLIKTLPGSSVRSSNRAAEPRNREMAMKRGKRNGCNEYTLHRKAKDQSCTPAHSAALYHSSSESEVIDTNVIT